MELFRITAAAALIVGAGLVHGTWTDRWGVSPELAALGAKFDSVPTVVGDWKATASSKLTPKERALTGAVACLSRQYTNPARGVTVSVLLLGGPPGKISTHTPDVCYAGGGYTLDPIVPFEYRYGPDGHRAEFRTALATRRGTAPSALRIFWSWNASAGWAAPDQPRLQFGTASTLCKLYVVRETAGAAIDPDRDPCSDFLNVFLPELDRLVFSAG